MVLLKVTVLLAGVLAVHNQRDIGVNAYVDRDPVDGPVNRSRRTSKFLECSPAHLFQKRLQQPSKGIHIENFLHTCV